VRPGQSSGCFDPVPFRVYQTLTQALANASDSTIRPFLDFGFAKRPQEELFHFPSDPDLIRNVAFDPKFSQTFPTLRARVKNWMSKTNDQRAKNPLENIFGRYRYYGGTPKNSK